MTPKKPVVQPGSSGRLRPSVRPRRLSPSPPMSWLPPANRPLLRCGVLSPYAPESYQWYTSDDPVSNTAADDMLIGGATSATYTIPNVALTDENYYYCKTSNVYNNVTYTTSSNAAALGVKRKVAHWTLDGLVDGKYPDSSGEGHNAQPGGIPVFVDGVNPTLTGNGVVVDLTNGWARSATWDPSQYSGQLTISAWVKWNGQPATPAYQGLLGKRRSMPPT